jgi:hypothetical protein
MTVKREMESHWNSKSTEGFPATILIICEVCQILGSLRFSFIPKAVGGKYSGWVGIIYHLIHTCTFNNSILRFDESWVRRKNSRDSRIKNC